MKFGEDVVSCCGDKGVKGLEDINVLKKTEKWTGI